MDDGGLTRPSTSRRHKLCLPYEVQLFHNLQFDPDGSGWMEKIKQIASNDGQFDEVYSGDVDMMDRSGKYRCYNIEEKQARQPIVKSGGGAGGSQFVGNEHKARRESGTGEQGCPSGFWGSTGSLPSDLERSKSIKIIDL